ncbi:MAG: chromosomal replication initiator protein DnaA [Candidatus Neomarinimicrobiota bacterium]
MVSATDLWQQVSEKIKPVVSGQTYATWFDPIRGMVIDDGTLTLEVPSRFYYEWIDTHYRSLILDKIREVSGSECDLKYSVVVGDVRGVGEETGVSEGVDMDGVRPRYYDRGSKLNKRYTFDSFVEGPNNQLAKAGAVSVADGPGQTSFNPLLIYGGVGLGKTHLLQAIGNAVLGTNVRAGVHYTTSEKFTLDFISAIQNNKTSDFSSRYRGAGLLLVDDIQFLQKKEQTQEQFFHTFNELYQQGKQIVLTTDRHPRELYGLKDRLVSRFQSGLIVDIQAPNLETRIAILQRKSEEDGLDIPYEITEFIATNIRSNIRELEGALIKLLAYSSLSHADITLDLAKRALRETLGKSAESGITIDDVIRRVSSLTAIPENKLIGKGRKMEVAHARQMAMYLCREMVGASLENIGLHFGGRDHTTVIHACRTVRMKMKADREFKGRMETIQMKLAA